MLAALRRLAERRRLVFFAGVPGAGKSLLARQLAQLAHAEGRPVQLLQWDVARPAFETDALLARYPEVGGVTHAVIRKAVGLWTRGAVSGWDARHFGDDCILIGETPLIGNRLIELARKCDDAAEKLLAGEQSRFVVPVPSREVRLAIEDARQRRGAAPGHERERADAMPRVMRELWRQLLRAARELGVPTQNGEGYSPSVYGAVYRSVLRHRHCEILPVDSVLEVGGRSVYDYDFPTHDIVPNAEEAQAHVEEVERRYPDLQTLERETRNWHVV